MTKRVSFGKLLKEDKCFFLAYDQGLEHGPSDFNEYNVDPLHIIELAKNGKFSGLVFQKGLAEQYRKEVAKSDVPLIVKLNGKTRLLKSDPISVQLCSVQEARKLGAAAVGYTIYPGSLHEAVMLREFEKIEMEAHSYGLPVIAWVYPRGRSVKGFSESELLAYSARIGLELGADMVKLHWEGSQSDLSWAVKSAGKCRVIVAGGFKKSDSVLLKQIDSAMRAGASGVAIGRNIWQHKNPLEITKKIRGLIWK